MPPDDTQPAHAIDGGRKLKKFQRKLERLAREISPTIAAERSPARVQAILTKRFREVCDEVLGPDPLARPTVGKTITKARRAARVRRNRKK